MKSTEDKVSLIVESNDLPAFKLWVVWEHGADHSSDAVAKSGSKVIENHLGGMWCTPSVVLYSVRRNK